jgi:hypothetical protein
MTLTLFLLLSQNPDRPAQLPPPVPSGETRIFLVRHAEKDTTVKTCPEGGSKCVPLTAAGEARAAELARLLKAHPLQGIFATDYKRVHDTARPSDRTPSLLVVFPAREQVDRVLAEIAPHPGTYLVVTHSDVVVPFLRRLLADDTIAITAGALPPATTPGGMSTAQPSSVIIDDPDYDNLFLITLRPSGEKTCQHFFYGAKTAGQLAVTRCTVQGRVP